MKHKKSKLTSTLIKCTAAMALAGVAGGAFADGNKLIPQGIHLLDFAMT
jgi:hypothetical protein